MARGGHRLYVDDDGWSQAVGRVGEDGLSLSRLTDEVWLPARVEAPRGLFLRLLARAAVEGRPAHRLVLDALSSYLAEPARIEAEPAHTDAPVEDEGSGSESS